MQRSATDAKQLIQQLEHFRERMAAANQSTSTAY
jgi:hypothetical protein